MTRNSSQKKAARDYQLANPGITFPAAVRHVTGTTALNAWRLGQKPWVRTLAPQEPTDCYLCGEVTSIQSYSDIAADHGRVAMYCDNGYCAARESEVVIVEDGTEHTRARSDVQVLERFGPTPFRNRWPDEDADLSPVGWAPGISPHAREHPARCLYCGEMSCTVDPGDDAADTGRVRLRCANPKCAVKQFVVVVMRDGNLASDRKDVRALHDLFPSQEVLDRQQGRHEDLEPQPLSYSLDPADGYDPVQYRISGPLPWSND